MHKWGGASLWRTQGQPLNWWVGGVSISMPGKPRQAFMSSRFNQRQGFLYLLYWLFPQLSKKVGLGKHWGGREIFLSQVNLAQLSGSSLLRVWKDLVWWGWNILFEFLVEPREFPPVQEVLVWGLLPTIWATSWKFSLSVTCAISGTQPSETQIGFPIGWIQQQLNTRCKSEWSMVKGLGYHSHKLDTANQRHFSAWELPLGSLHAATRESNPQMDCNYDSSCLP